MVNVGSSDPKGSRGQRALGPLLSRSRRFRSTAGPRRPRWSFVLGALTLFLVALGCKPFLYRTVAHFEYKKISSDEQSTELIREFWITGQLPSNDLDPTERDILLAASTEGSSFLLERRDLIFAVEYHACDTYGLGECAPGSTYANMTISNQRTGNILDIEAFFLLPVSGFSIQARDSTGTALEPTPSMLRNILAALPDRTDIHFTSAVEDVRADLMVDEVEYTQLEEREQEKLTTVWVLRENPSMVVAQTKLVRLVVQSILAELENPSAAESAATFD